MDYPYLNIQQVGPTPTPRLTKAGFLVRVAVSIVLEAGFALLCVVCLRKPLPLNVPLSLSNAKAAFTVISIAWQLIATLPLADIVSHCFSSEWYFQVTQTNTLIPGQTDVVSIVTAGALDQLKYAWTSRASNRFRAAFVIGLVCVAIRTVVPGSLSPVMTLHEEKARVRVARARDVDNDVQSVWFYTWLYRAGMIGWLEQQKVLTFGLEPPRGWMVGWPSSLAKGLEGTLRYPTDVVHFDFQCTWEDQDFLNQDNGTVTFSPQPLSPRGVEDRVIEGSAVLPFIPTSYGTNDSRVAFLLSGENSQSSSITPPGRGPRLNLDGLPAFNTSGLSFEISLESWGLNAPAAALLVCDPHVEHSGGEVRLYPNGSFAITRSQGPPIGNIDNSSEFLRRIVQELVTVFFSPDVDREVYFTLPSIQAFLPDTEFATLTDFSDHRFAPLSTKEIAGNLNGVTTSIAKAFSSGAIIGESFGVPASSLLFDVDGWVEKEQLLLGANSRLFWIGVGLWLLNVCLVGLLGWLTSWEVMKPFALESILDVLRKE